MGRWQPSVATQIERILARQRKELLKIERDADAEIVRAYRHLYQNIRYELDDLLREIAATDTPKVSTLHRSRRYRNILRVIEEETYRFAQQTAGLVTRAQLEALHRVASHQRELLPASLGPAPGYAIAAVDASFVTFPLEAFQQMVGNAGDGKPLGDLLEKIAPKARQELADVLTDGVARGLSPRQTARLFRRKSGVTATRALTISRTETLRAYRQATHETMQANRAIVQKWIWHAQLDDRTCSSCAIMSGTEHSVDEPFGSHINCRCAQVPKTATWEDLGFKGIPDTNPQIPKGTDWLDKLSDAKRDRIMGKGVNQLHREGKVNYKDLVTKTSSKKWGKGVKPTPLKELV